MSQVKAFWLGGIIFGALTGLMVAFILGEVCVR
jgi:hypothetical protein